MNSPSHEKRRASAGAMMSLQSWKLATRDELENYFRNRRSPRLVFTLMLMFTGVAGLVLCQAMLKMGLVVMWVRYPLAVLGAYGFFLLLLRGWVAWEHFCFDHRLVNLVEPPPDADDTRIAGYQRPQQSLLDSYGDRTSWLDWLDIGFPDVFEPEGCMVVLLLSFVVAVIGSVGFAIADAPVLIADVFLDSVLVSVLYRSLRRADSKHWLSKAIRRTYSRVLWLAVLLGIFGAILQALAPDCHSFGPALRRVFGSDGH